MRHPNYVGRRRRAPGLRAARPGADRRGHRHRRVWRPPPRARARRGARARFAITVESGRQNPPKNMVQRSRAASALDWMALALVILAAAIALSGGLSVRLGGQRLTARSPDRAVLAALAVVALRVALDRRTRPLGRRAGPSRARCATASTIHFRIRSRPSRARERRGGLGPSRSPASRPLPPCCSSRSCSGWTRFRIWAIRSSRSGGSGGCFTSSAAIRVRSSARTCSTRIR